MPRRRGAGARCGSLYPRVCSASGISSVDTSSPAMPTGRQGWSRRYGTTRARSGRTRATHSSSRSGSSIRKAPACLLSVGRSGFLFLFIVNLVLALLLGCWIIKAGLRAVRSGADDRFLWLGIATLVPLYLVAPGAALGVSDPGSRLLQTGLALALVLCCRSSGWPLRAAAGCSTILSLVGILLFARFAFGPETRPPFPGALPKTVAEFAHVPNHDQDSFYEALERGDYQLKVFSHRHVPEPALVSSQVCLTLENQDEADL